MDGKKLRLGASAALHLNEYLNIYMRFWTFELMRFLDFELLL